MSDDLQWRIQRLEDRLDSYHQWLEESLEHDRKFQLQATWGVVNSLVGLGAFSVTAYVADRWLHMDGWILGTIAAVVGWLAWGAAFLWSDKGREGDEEKLSRLPAWRKVN
jgi:hypothetical protein